MSQLCLEDTNIEFDEDELSQFETPRLERQDNRINIETNETSEETQVREISEKIFYQPECPICYTNLTPEDGVALLCGHPFCAQDLQTMINISNLIKCPLCRQIQFVESVEQLKEIRQNVQSPPDVK